MGIKTGSGIEALFGAIFGEMTEDVEIGKTSEETLQAYKDLGEERVRIAKEIDQKVDEFAAKLHAEYTPQKKAVEEKSAQLWETVYAELKIPEDQQDEEYELDVTTGVIVHRRLKQRGGESNE